MSAIPSQFVAQQKASLDAFLALQNTAFAGFEKLVDLNLRAAKASLDEATQKSQEIVALEDPQQVFAFATSLARPSAEKLMAYSKNVYDIVAGVQAEVGKLAESQIAETQKQMAETVNQLAKNAPAGSESAVAFMKSSLATATSAYDSLSKAAKQAAEVAESSMVSATNATLDAAATVPTVVEESQQAASGAARATPAARRGNA